MRGGGGLRRVRLGGKFMSCRVGEGPMWRSYFANEGMEGRERVIGTFFLTEGWAVGKVR